MRLTEKSPRDLRQYMQRGNDPFRKNGVGLAQIYPAQPQFISATYHLRRLRFFGMLVSGSNDLINFTVTKSFLYDHDIRRVPPFKVSINSSGF
jgi:hypothetical protein